MRLWDVRRSGCGTSEPAIAAPRLRGHAEQVKGVAVWCLDQNHVISGSGDTTVRLWDLRTGQCLRVMEGHTSTIWSVAVSADGRLALSASYDRTVRLWEIETGRCLAVLRGHTQSVREVSWAGQAARAVSADYGGTVCTSEALPAAEVR